MQMREFSSFLLFSSSFFSWSIVLFYQLLHISHIFLMNFPDFLNGFPEHYLLNFKEARGEKVCYGASRFSPADITALSGQTKLKLLLLLLLLLWNGLKHDFGTSILRPDFRSLSSKIITCDLELRPNLAASKFRKFWRFATFEYRFPNYSWLVFLLTEPNSTENMSTQNPQSMIKKLVPTWRFLKQTSPEKWDHEWSLTRWQLVEIEV